MMKTAAILSLVFISSMISAPTLKPLSQSRIRLSEPSDICAVTGTDEFILLADKAFVYRIDSQGQVLSKLDFTGFDLEAICQDDESYYISEETFKEIYQISKSDFKLIKTIPVNHFGGRNEGVEAMVYLPETKRFVLATEKDPQVFITMDQSMNLIGTFTIPGITEVSSMTYYQGRWYVLGDEASTVFQINIQTRVVEKEFKLPVINPEGLAFSNNGQLLVVSDDMARLFKFEIPVK